MKQNTGLSPIHPLSLLVLFITAGLLCNHLPAKAETVKAPQWDITADKMTRYENPPSIIAEGNVILKKTQEVIVKKAKKTNWDTLLTEKAPVEQAAEAKIETKSKTLTTIQADWIAYDINLGAIKARGNLLVKIGQDQLKAAKGAIDLNNETGTFNDATIIRKEQNLHLEGKVIEKTGALTYHIQDGWIITCKLKENQNPPWSFAAKDATITDDGYAVLKHTTFRIKNIPVLYTPWIMVPVKRTRQTGFLFPVASLSERDGLGINLPFFLNLSSSSDLTIYPEYLSKRGLMTGLEFRYITDAQSKGGLMTNYLSDNLTDPSEIEYYQDNNFTHTNKDRYWIRGKADQNISGWVTRLDLDVVSDRDFLTEFNSSITGFSSSNAKFLDVFGRGFDGKTIDQRKNTLRLLKAWNNMSLQGNLAVINDVRADKSSPSPLWRLPDIKYTGLLPMGETMLNLGWDVNYINYWRENGTGAHRLDIFPRLSAPLPLGDYLEATAELGLRDTSYLIKEYGDGEWQGNDTENRLLADFQTEIGTTLVRDFGINISDVNTISHTFRPFVNYHYIPDVDQSDLPSFDNIDRINDRNLITYGIDNWFQISGSNNKNEYERTYGYIKIKQGYDLRDEESDTPLTPLHAKIGLYPMRNFQLVYRTDIDVYGEGPTRYSLESNYMNSRGDYLSADYRYDKSGKINSISANAQVHIIHNLLAKYYIESSLATSTVIEENIALVYQPSCWSMELATNYTQGDRKIMLIFRLSNIGNPLGIDLPGF